jgi:hypothetical protein
VHSVEELAAMARGQLGEQQGYTAGPWPGPPPPPDGPWPGQPSDGTLPGPLPDGPLPGPPPGYTGQARPGPSRPRPSRFEQGSGDGYSIGDDVADAALSAATRFIGRAIGRRVRRTYNERVLPTVAARQEAMLREQIAIAERHPDLRACLTDRVIFLVGGSRVLPMASIAGNLTLEQSDVLVARLRDG